MENLQIVHFSISIKCLCIIYLHSLHTSNSFKIRCACLISAFYLVFNNFVVNSKNIAWHFVKFGRKNVDLAVAHVFFFNFLHFFGVIFLERQQILLQTILKMRLKILLNNVACHLETCETKLYAILAIKLWVEKTNKNNVVNKMWDLGKFYIFHLLSLCKTFAKRIPPCCFHWSKLYMYCIQYTWYTEVNNVAYKSLKRNQSQRLQTSISHW